MRPAALLGAALALASLVACFETDTFPIESSLEGNTGEIEGTGTLAWRFSAEANADATHEDPMASLFEGYVWVVAYLDSCPECTTDVTLTVRCGQSEETATITLGAGEDGFAEGSTELYSGCEPDEACSRECEVEVAAEGDLLVSVDVTARATVWVEESRWDDAEVVLEVED